MPEPNYTKAMRREVFFRAFTSGHRMASRPYHVVVLVDAVMVILLFFLIQSSYVFRPAVQMLLPESKHYKGVPYQATVLTILNSKWLYFDDQQISWQQLPQKLEELALEKPDLPLVLQVDANVREPELIRIQDLATDAGIMEIAIAVKPKRQQENVADENLRP